MARRRDINDIDEDKEGQIVDYSGDSDNGLIDLLWPKPLTEMTVVKLNYQLKLTNHTILYYSN